MKINTNNFQKIRCSNGMTIRQIADGTGLDVDTIYDNLRGARRSIRWDTLYRLCRILRCAPEEIADMD